MAINFSAGGRMQLTCAPSWMRRLMRSRDPLETKLKATVSTAMSTAIRGAGLIGWGIAHFFFSSLLEPAWGIAFNAIGILNLAVPRRFAFCYQWACASSRLVAGMGISASWELAVCWVCSLRHRSPGDEEMERFDPYFLANIRRRRVGGAEEVSRHTLTKSCGVMLMRAPEQDW